MAEGNENAQGLTMHFQNQISFKRWSNHLDQELDHPDVQIGAGKAYSNYVALAADSGRNWAVSNARPRRLGGAIHQRQENSHVLAPLKPGVDS